MPNLMVYNITLGVIIIVLFIAVYKWNATETFSKLENNVIPENIHQLYLHGYKLIHKLFGKNNIFYVVEGRILIKLIKKSKLFFWDDVGNVFSWRYHKNNILDLTDKFAKRNYILTQTNNPDILRLFLDSMRNIYIDIKLYDEPDLNNNNNNTENCIFNSKCDTHKNYNINDLEPRHIYQLENIQVFGPSNPMPYIYSNYGPSALLNPKITNTIIQYDVSELYDTYEKIN